MNQYGYTKENIKNRMYKRAAALWDIRDVDNLDPIVKLMIESLASEVFGLSGEMQDMEGRLLSKMANELTPTAMATAMPAHAIVHATSTGNETPIDGKTEFHYKNPAFMQKHGLKRLVFSPVVNTRLVQAKVGYFIADGDLYALNAKMMKDKIARPHQKLPLFNNSIWIGLNIAKEVASINHLSFYFDFPYIENKENYFHLLPYTKWSLKGEPLTTEAGIYQTKPGNKNADRAFLDNYDILSKIDKDITALYNQRYITIHQPIDNTKNNQSILPAEVADMYSKEINEVIQKPLIWIKVEFPPYYTNKEISEVFVSCNAVPTANKYLHETEHQIDPFNTILPLPKYKNEAFLTIEMVSDERGKIYFEEHAKNFHESINGTYAIRRGGAERFNSTDARQFLIRLLDLLRDESVAFTNVERDTLDQNTNSLIKQINHLEHKINLNNDKEEVPNYLIIDHKEASQILVLAKFWLTNGPIANGLNAAEPLSYNGYDDIDKTDIMFLSASKGGKNAPDELSKTRLFKNTLISKGSIYSSEDISSYCLAQYGHLITKVEVKKGYDIGSGPQEGLISTIDVYLKLKPHTDLDEQNEIRYNLISGLKYNAPDDFNFRLFIISTP
ncbi:type VI secretion system baseplate subunit TssF [Geofilum rubicundum]|uniref:Uncharacterized protein n=1 Tax=Geofilum rubicundum JCM 15548 TaxID=1236989 RepID=A0A0E9M0H0_9BACT|nr:type VI secretion system baseplate subunit TssF [Geofilum rubicundum]GAO31038.1 hypothetical protein JCM15548_13372 [Geofilum rubicundum JCM 15548]